MYRVGPMNSACPSNPLEVESLVLAQVAGLGSDNQVRHRLERHGRGFPRVDLRSAGAFPKSDGHGRGVGRGIARPRPGHDRGHESLWPPRARLR